eukprot:6458122-Amphidinium_carterae.1
MRGAPGPLEVCRLALIDHGSQSIHPPVRAALRKCLNDHSDFKVTYTYVATKAVQLECGAERDMKATRAQSCFLPCSGRHTIRDITKQEKATVRKSQSQDRKLQGGFSIANLTLEPTAGREHTQAVGSGALTTAPWALKQPDEHATCEGTKEPKYPPASDTNKTITSTGASKNLGPLLG